MLERVIEAQEALDWLHARYFAEDLRPSPSGPGPAGRRNALVELPGDDRALLDKALKAKNGAKLRALLMGELAGNASASEADLALCSILAFWTQDPAQIDRIFRDSGLYRPKWDQKHRASGATYGEETIRKALEGCKETYQSGRGTGRRRASPAAPTADGGAGLPLIRLEAGALPRNVAEAGAALVKAGAAICQRGAGLVRPVVIETPKTGKAGAVPAGALILMPVDEAWLQKEITRAARLEKYDGRVKDWVVVNCPPWLAKGLLASAGEWPFPVLTGILETPTLRPDGSLLSAPGYDPATGLYLHLAPGLAVKIRDKPTREHAIEAARFLLDPLTEFPFEDQAALAVALAAILTALIRRFLPTAPGFVFDAPAPGSGKTLLADIVALIATGRRAPIMNQAMSDEETEKRIGSFLLQGHAVLNLDNIERPLSGELLCSLLTAPEVTVRILGESRTPAISTNLVFLTTGNNVTVKNDMSRRVLVCRLDPGTERPDEREFNLNPYEWIPQHRGKLISAGLTILKAYQSAGRPDVGLKPYGSFDDWSAWVRGALVWVGHQDPCQTRTRLEGADHVTGQLAAILNAWNRELHTAKLSVKEVREKCAMAADAELRAALLEVASSKRDPNDIDGKRLSHALRKNEGRIVGGLRLRRETTADGDLWRVEAVGTHA